MFLFRPFFKALVGLTILLQFSSVSLVAEANSEPEWKPPRLLIMGSSMLIGKMNNCMAERLESYGYDANIAGFCGLSTKGLANGGRYPCPYAKFTGKPLVHEIGKSLRLNRKPKSGVAFNHKGVKLVTKSGKLLVNHLVKKLQPDHVVFYLGGNEAGYKTRRTLNTEAKRAEYRRKLHLYIHADTLLSKLKTDASCSWITGSWVSKVTSGYGKTNEEMVEVAKVLSEEAGGRCSMILGTEVMGKKEVRTSDGLHLDPEQSCLFGQRVADRLNEQLVLSRLSDRNIGKSPGNFFP